MKKVSVRKALKAYRDDDLLDLLDEVVSKGLIFPDGHDVKDAYAAGEITWAEVLEFTDMFNELIELAEQFDSRLKNLWIVNKN